ncbi:DUF397 domain-containing protein [Streptomyces profundus]|uniref:DUF397 domain-containing protein n=1 Tax=Streptomyces profundus TaxID=2867410 RepID=UPI001D1624D3|nr:DUF397 domain-containing protein [Streptomyces sp. MA3_2.13]UED84085.1 DUF397 domain-containing protein [Streptomyces sp. MA3_2.13]
MYKVDLHVAEWLKSSYSNGQGECVEVARLDHVVGLRDSKRSDSPVLAVAPAQWTAFLDGFTRP